MNILPESAEAVRLLQEYLDRSIPLVPQMQVRVVSLDEHRLQLEAPLEPNRNHIGTVFGGSLNALATLSCWGLVWLALHGRGAHIVIHEGRMKFLKPADGTFTAACRLPEQDALAEFVAQYERRGRARLALVSEVNCNGRIVATFEGAFAAINPERRESR